MNKNKKTENLKNNKEIDYMGFTNNIDYLKPDENKANDNNRKKTNSNLYD